MTNFFRSIKFAIFCLDFIGSQFWFCSRSQESIFGVAGVDADPTHGAVPIRDVGAGAWGRGGQHWPGVASHQAPLTVTKEDETHEEQEEEAKDEDDHEDDVNVGQIIVPLLGFYTS